MELTLHIGLKKTATSTLQRVLNGSKAELLGQGLLFPCRSDQHHRLARRVRRRPVETEQAVREALAQILDEVRAVEPRRVLLSSEHLISFQAMGLAELRELLEGALPGVRIRVLAYVREPVAFATSMCQQNVKNGVRRLAEVYADPWPFPLADCLGTQIGVFGRENVTVRQFHPGHLVGGNIVADALVAVGLEEARIEGSLPRLNLSMTWEGVMVADALSGLRPGPERDQKARSDYLRPQQDPGQQVRAALRGARAGGCGLCVGSGLAEHGVRAGNPSRKSSRRRRACTDRRQGLGLGTADPGKGRGLRSCA